MRPSPTALNDINVQVQHGNICTTYIYTTGRVGLECGFQLRTPIQYPCQFDISSTSRDYLHVAACAVPRTLPTPPTSTTHRSGPMRCSPRRLPNISDSFSTASCRGDTVIDHESCPEMSLGHRNYLPGYTTAHGPNSTPRVPSKATSPPASTLAVT